MPRKKADSQPDIKYVVVAEGNTIENREELKDLGFVWNPEHDFWTKKPSLKTTTGGSRDLPDALIAIYTKRMFGVSLRRVREEWINGLY